MEEDVPELPECDVQDNQTNKKEEKALSKKQMKKLIKKEKWEKEKLVKRQEKRMKEKEKKKEKKLLLKEEKQQQPNQNEDKEAKEAHQLMRKRRDDYVEKMKEGLPVIIDLQFWDLMTEKEQGSLVKQLSHCHSTNRKAEKCFNYILTSSTKQRQKILAERYNADKWGITMHEESLIDVFPREKLIYLTGDAEEDIQKFQPELVYIIGGIVDHNRLKKITYNYAIQNKIAVKRLPMHHTKLKASVHLAVNHVWQWMLKGYNGVDWDQALKSIIPLRKLQETEQK